LKRCFDGDQVALGLRQSTASMGQEFGTPDLPLKVGICQGSSEGNTTITSVFI